MNTEPAVLPRLETTRVEEATVYASRLAFATAVAKGGHGDLRVMDALVGTDHLKHPLQRAFAALVRGGAIMVVPLALWRDTYIAFSSFMLSVFDPAKVGPLVERIEFGAPLLLGAYGLALVGGYLTAEETWPWLLDAGETLLLVAYFLVVPVVISIGLYFPLWYSMRQSGRSTMLHRESPADQEGLPMLAVWAAFIGGALATGTLAALLWWLVPNPLGAATLLPGLVAFYTIFVCIIALPHVVVGDWLDRGRGIWYVP